MNRRFYIIHNPMAGKRRHRVLAETVRELSELGSLVTVQVTHNVGHAIELARDTKDADVIVAAGGDGTVGEVVHGLMTRPQHDRPLFATIPLGTVNVLAVEMGLENKLVALAKTLATGKIRQMTVGVANGRHFMLATGAGVDAAAVRYLTPPLKKVFGQGAYYYAMIRALITEGNTVFEMEVEVDGVWQKFKVSSVIVTNATRFGGPHVVAPDARLDDGMLHVLLGMKHGRWNLMRYGAAYLRGKLFTLPDVRIITALRLRILSPIGKPVQLDGDNVLTLPVEISVAKETLGVICPD